MAASPTASSASAAAAAAATAAEATDGPVLAVVSKRLRALRKKQNRILQMEESLASGKKLNREQEEVLRSKPVVVALIDELERMRAPLSSAMAEELSSRPAAPSPSSSSAGSGPDPTIQDLLALFYFGTLFDVKPQSEFVGTMVARTHERSCCITYDYVTDDAADLLQESDLDTLSSLASLGLSRPAAAVGVSHRDALQACARHAHLWIRRADEPVHPDSSITYASARAKLDRIMASDYYTAQPEMKATLDMAAAVGSYGVGGVHAQESIVVSPEAPAVEENLAAEGHKDAKEDQQVTEAYTDQSDVVDAQNVNDEALVNPPEEFTSAEVEQHNFEADVEEKDQRNEEPQDEQFITQRGGGRRGYSNGRGGRGGRGMGGGGYQNGRGGGGYQNGRGGGGGYQSGGYQGGRGGGGGYQGGRGGGGGYQNGRGGGGGYYPDSGYYQQRNYNRGRGGRSGGNSYYNNQGGGQQGGVELGANA